MLMREPASLLQRVGSGRDKVSENNFAIGFLLEIPLRL